MAPHWTLALILMISAIMIACASGKKFRCGYHTYLETECVRPERCLAIYNNVRGCPGNQICCASDDISFDEYMDNTPPPLVKCGPNHACLRRSMCRDIYQLLQFRSIKVPETRYERCRYNLVCCNVEFMDYINI